MDGSLLILTGVTLFLASAVLFLARAYRNLVIEFEALRVAQGGRDFAKAQQKATKLVEDARGKSLEIIEESEEKAQEIIKSTDLFATTTQEEFAEDVAKATQKYLLDYKKELDDVKQNVSQSFEKLAERLEKQAVSEMSTLHDKVEQTAGKTEQNLQTKLADAYQAAQAEIAEYKQKRMADFEQQIGTLAQQILKQLVNKSLSPTEHRALIATALEEAKKNNVF
jgi:F0F1-type ATP synthase membrane subunit b/b'